MNQNKLVKLLLVTLPLLLSACKAVNILNAVIPATGYTLTEGVAYGVANRQKLDIYHPIQAADNHELIIFIYGGAWRQGNRSEYEFIGQALSSAGHTVVIPDYRLYPDVIFPDFITDIVMAIDSLPTQATLSAIDTRSIVLMGHSSGAHSAALLSTDSSYLLNTGVFVKALIGLSGPYDLPLDNDEVIPVFSGASPDKSKPVLLADASHPRTLLIHGLSDRRVVPRHTRTFSRVLKENGVSVTTHLLDGENHAGILAGIAAPLQFTNDTLRYVLEFLADSDGS
jgi:acetyl esterase/lipase